MTSNGEVNQEVEGFEDGEMENDPLLRKERNLPKVVTDGQRQKEPTDETAISVEKKKNPGEDYNVSQKTSRQNLATGYQESDHQSPHKTEFPSSTKTKGHELKVSQNVKDLSEETMDNTFEKPKKNLTGEIGLQKCEQSASDSRQHKHEQSKCNSKEIPKIKLEQITTNNPVKTTNETGDHKLDCSGYNLVNQDLGLSNHNIEKSLRHHPSYREAGQQKYDVKDITKEPAEYKSKDSRHNLGASAKEVERMAREAKERPKVKDVPEHSKSNLERVIKEVGDKSMGSPKLHHLDFPRKDLKSIVEQEDQPSEEIDVVTNLNDCDSDKKPKPTHQRTASSSIVEIVPKKLPRTITGTDLASYLPSNSSPNFRRENSVRSLRGDFNGGKPSSDCGSHFSKPFSEAGSIRSWASVGMGSTDGKKMIIRRIPTSPVELFNIVNPPTPPEEYLYDAETDDDDVDEDSVYIKPRRQHWSNKLQFVLACVGYSVGLGSVWRFPYLCYKSGGGVFLIPYFIIMIICGVPMLYMELSVGQFTGRGPIGALGHLCPLLKGTGLGSVVISFLMSTYYSVIIAYGIYYFFTSFKSKQPWEDCSNRWNTPNCWVTTSLSENVSKPMNSQSPSEEFYDYKVLQIGHGIEDFINLRWELVACLLCAWILVYFAIWKSIKSSAKVRYFTATLPFVLIIVFLAKSLTLEGADKGMRYFFKPNWVLLGDAKVWVNAAAQTFNSMGIAFGSMISFASYNKYNNNILHDTLAVSFVNAITSILVGIFAFATIGNIASEHNTTIEDVIADGPGLIFVVYPQAMVKMPAAQLWAVLFFFMLLCLSLNSQFAIVEVVVTSIQDGFPVWIKKNLMCHEVLVLIICVVSFLFGLPNVTRGGIYFFQLIDHYAATVSTMYLAFFELIAIAWVYGARRLSSNVKTMTGRHPGWFFQFCWMFATPSLLFALWVFLLIDYEPPSYNNGEYKYPVWAIVLGWIVASLSILCIPIYMVYVFVQSPGETLFEKLKNSLQSDLCEKCPKCEEMDCDCIRNDDDIEPMLVLHSPEIKSENYSAAPFFIPQVQSRAGTPNVGSNRKSYQVTSSKESSESNFKRHDGDHSNT